MKKLKFWLSCAIALSLLGGMASCQSEDIVSPSDENSMVVNAVAHVTVEMENQTRASFTPGTSGLAFAWSENDQIVVISEDGQRNIGVMTLVDGTGEKWGDFEGKLNVKDSDTKAHVYYMGRKTTSGLKSLSFSKDFDVSAQEAALENITDYDIMHADADLVRDERGNVAMEFQIMSLVSSARFCFHLPENVTAANEAVTIKGHNIYNAFILNFADATLGGKEEGAISIVPDWSNSEGGDAFMMFVPATDAVTEFEVTVDGTVYKATLDSKEYAASKFYCGGNPLHGKDIYFTRNGEWTLSYVAGQKATNVPSPQIVSDVFTPSYQFTVSDKVPVLEGYKFLGWADAEHATEVKYTANSTVTLTRPETSKTIYAVWQEEEWHYRTYTLYYGENGKYRSENQSYGPGSKQPWIFFTSNYDEDYPVKDGYTFLGWADTENATAVQYAKENAEINLGKSVFEKTVYPVWKKNGTEGNVTAPGSKGTDY